MSVRGVIVAVALASLGLAGLRIVDGVDDVDRVDAAPAPAVFTADEAAALAEDIVRLKAELSEVQARLVAIEDTASFAADALEEAHRPAALANVAGVVEMIEGRLSAVEERVGTAEGDGGRAGEGE
jgi:hypothetical protein